MSEVEGQVENQVENQVVSEVVSEVQKADPRARRTSGILVAVAALVGVLVIWLARSYMSRVGEWVVEDPASTIERVRVVALVLSATLAVPTLALAVHLWRTGTGIVASERFPPPGITVTRDTAVIRGDAARRRGRTLQILGCLMAVAAAGLVGILWRLVFLLGARVA